MQLKARPLDQSYSLVLATKREAAQRIMIFTFAAQTMKIFAGILPAVQVKNFMRAKPAPIVSTRPH
jgi:hypothetical protein